MQSIPRVEDQTCDAQGMGIPFHSSSLAVYCVSGAVGLGAGEVG